MAKLKGPVVPHPDGARRVVITYNLPEVTKPLNLTGPVIADIFLGKITKWNAPEIAALNKGVTLPNKDILVVHRTDGSGTTYIFSDYLSDRQPGVGSPARARARSSVARWSRRQGQRRRDRSGEADARARSATSSSRTRARTSFRLRRSRTQPGEFVLPTIESTTAAGAGVAGEASGDDGLPHLDRQRAGKGAYPISSFTFILLYQNAARTPRRARSCSTS